MSDKQKKALDRIVKKYEAKDVTVNTLDAGSVRVVLWREPRASLTFKITRFGNATLLS